MKSCIHFITGLLLCFSIFLARFSESKLAEFNVMEFGAGGNGHKDDSKAFQSAWKAACQNGSQSSTLIVPSGHKYLVFPTRFEGPCKSPLIKFKILGTIIAPSKSAWKDYVDEWLWFHGVNGLHVIGNGQGSVDGHGDSWWQEGKDVDRPTAMRFSNCGVLEVRGLKHLNSQRNHISLDSCKNANLSNLHMIAPGKSPNTDGIDIVASTNIIVNNCTMETGDDCIAINGGSSQITISQVACGPGHGISIGSLGKKNYINTVENVRVTNCSFNGTQNGVRIKTWPRGEGFVRNVNFSDITFTDVNNPVLINQRYCPHKTCEDEGSKIKISNIRYSGLRGTCMHSNATINLQCSKLAPCTHHLRSYQYKSNSFSCSNICTVHKLSWIGYRLHKPSNELLEGLTRVLFSI